MTGFFNRKTFLFSKLFHKPLQHNYLYRLSCFRYVKDTKMKANHNYIVPQPKRPSVVSDMSKILK